LALSIAVAAWAASFGAAPPPAQGGPAPSLRPPALVRRVDAVYPPEALAIGAEAEVTIEVTVGIDGRVSDPRVVSSGGEAFDAAAVAAVRQWSFAPAREGDAPVAVRIRVPFSFRVPARAEPGGPPEAAGAGAPSPPPPSGAPAAPPESAPATGPMPERPSPETMPAPPPAPVPSAAPSAQAEAGAAEGEEALEATVRGRAKARSRGTADYDVSVGQLSIVPRKAADELLKLAPGILLTNEGGQGHASQIFLRGFDAREGQDIELSVAGVPVNEAGNLHGNGYADLHFVIPEVVAQLRILEGPFDPRQGNFAVAGSAEYELGLEDRGVGVRVGSGSFGTRRVLALWGPPGASRGTFGAAEVWETDGFGRNRDATRGSAMGQYEGRLGAETLFRFTFQGYSARWHSAGLLREDDHQAGRIGFLDTYDPGQGGNATRLSLSGELESSSGRVTFRNQAYVVLSSSRLRENFTGFLLDTQEPIQPLHAQRGDLIDRSTSATTFGARGFARSSFEALGRRHEAELGYFVRYDVTDGSEYRVEAATNHPYHLDLDLLSRVADIGVYGDLSLVPFSWLTVRGGGRVDFFTYDVLNRCAVHDVAHPSRTNPPGDQSCLDQEDFGRHREPVQPAGTASSTLEPRVTALVTPFPHVTLSASYGVGIRSIDPQFVTQDVKTPFSTARSAEIGAAYARDLPGLALALRTTAFRTRLDRDLIFSESAGRNEIGGSSTRLGWLGAARITGSWLDAALNATFVRATFDDTGDLIAYIPDLVVRSDTSVWHALPWWRPGGVPLEAAAGVGVTYVGRRPLPFGERSDVILTVDASMSLAWRPFKLALEATNVLDTRYRLGERNYASDFHSQRAPTLVPVRHFSAGDPRIVMLSLQVLLGGGRP
jgi:TonB family protein